MNINQITIYHLDMPLIHPFETSFGRETNRECLIIAARTENFTGWGECVVTDKPDYSPETISTAWHILKDFLIPALLTNPVTSIEDLITSYQWIRGHYMAKAGLQAAVWDLLAQIEGKSLAAILAEPYPVGPLNQVKVRVSVGIQPSIADTLARIEDFLSQGFSRIKLKIKPGWDLKLLSAVRDVFPDIPLMVDANSAYTLNDAKVIKQMDDFNLTMIEQPLAHDDIYQHSKLQDLIRTSICLDESIHTPEQAEWALGINACEIINIKPGRVGGLWESRLIHDICEKEGIPVWCGGMLETGIGRAANLAIASLPNFTLPSDTGPTERYWAEDIIEEVFSLNKEDSTIDVPALPGLGVSVNLDQIDGYLIRKEEFN
jgi:O-succinylbenzoate synthase